MCKKLWVAALAVAVGLLIVATPIAGIVISHAKVAWDEAERAAEEAQPIDYQIKVLEARLPVLKDEIKKHQVAIAREEVALEDLRDQIKKDEAGVARQQSQVDRLIAALKTSPNSDYVNFTENGRERQVKRDILEQRLESALATLKTADQALESKKVTLKSREEALTHAHDRWEQMKANYEQSKNDIERLKADYAALQAQQSRQTLPTDDSKMAQFRTDLKKVENRIKVEKKLVDQEPGSLPVETKDRGDILKEAEDYRNKDNSKISVIKQ
jgi:chromosome segregation ATPase